MDYLSQRQGLQGGMRNQHYPWQQPPDSFAFMLNGVLENDEKSQYGASFEESTEALFQFPEGYKLRGWKDIVQRDAFLLFMYDEKKKVSEIGMYYKAKKAYVKLFNDADLKDGKGQLRKLGFSRFKKIRPVVFIKEPCSHMHVLWSSCGVYYALDIDGDLCNLKYEDIVLLVSPCKGESSMRVLETGGQGLPGGAYYVALRFNDSENNYTNFFPLEGPVYLETENNKPGEISEQAITIEYKDVNAKIFDRVELAVVSRSAGVTRYALLPPIFLSKSTISYNHRSPKEYVRELTHDDIEIREDRDIQGEKLEIVNGMLVLFQVYGKRNPYLQPIADKVKVGWIAYLCPIKEAHKYTTMSHNEVYSLALGENYADGMKSRGFHIPGREANAFDMELITPDKGSPAVCQERIKVTLSVDICGRAGVNKYKVVVAPHGSGIVTHLDGILKTQLRGIDHETLTFAMNGPVIEQQLKMSGVKEGTPVNVILDFNVVLDGKCRYSGRIFMNVVKGDPKAPGADCFKTIDLNNIESDDRKDAIPGDRNGNCTECPQPRWKVQNTATVEKWYCYDPFDKSKGSFKKPAYVPLCNNGVLEITAENRAGDPQSLMVGGSLGEKRCSSCGGGGSQSGIEKCNNTEGQEVPCNDPSAESACVGGGCSGDAGTENETSPNCKKWALSPNICIIKKYDSDGERPNVGEAFDSLKECIDCAPGLLDKLLTIQWTTDTEFDLKNLKVRHRNGKVVDITETPIYNRYFAAFEKDPNTPNADDQFNKNSPGAGVPRTQAATLEQDCSPKPIYDSTGCVILGYDLPVFAEGTTGYWESEEEYPTFEICDGQPFYGQNAGRKIRHPLMPPEDLIPHFISFQNGVPHRFDPANDELQDGYVILLGLKITGLEANPDPVKEICEEKPYSILYEERNATNSRVIDKGLMVPTFKAEYQGDVFAYPRNGVSSLELFDAHIAWKDDPDKVVRHRGGVLNDKPQYMFYGVNTRFDRPPLDVHQAYVNFNIYGSGWRFGVNAEDPHMEKSFFFRPRNQKGARSAVHLNHYERLTIKNILVPGKCMDQVNVQIDAYYCTENYVGPQNGEPGHWVHTGQLYYTAKILNKLPSEVALFSVDIRHAGKTVNITVREDIDITSSYAHIPNMPLTADFAVKVVLKGANGGSPCNYEQETLPYTFEKRDATFNETPAQAAQRLALCRKIWNLRMISKDFVPPVYEQEQNSPVYCVRSASYIRGDSIFKDARNFSYPLMNKYRESGVFLEFMPDQLPLQLVQDIDPYLSDGNYNGYSRHAGELRANHTADGSFFGDGRIHEYPIFLASAWYTTLLRYLPKQYGTLFGNKYTELFPVYKDEVLCGKKSTICGDEYVGYHSLKRSSFVSDHHGDDTSPGGYWQDKFGVPDCGKYLEPCSRSDDDSRIANFLRPGNPPWDGNNPFPGISETRTSVYWPGIQHMAIGLWVQSRINIHYPQTGIEEIGQLHYHRRPSYNVDSNYPHESNPNTAFLNMFHMRIYGMSSADKLMIILILFLKFTPLLFGMAGGWFGLLVGLLTTTIFTHLLDQKEAADWILGFRECRQDSRGGLGEGRIQGYHDNYKGYNFDYSTRNIYSPWFGITDKYNTCECLENITNGLKWSNVQGVDSLQDAFRKFKPNNLLPLSTETGMVSRIIKWGGQVWLHDENSMQNTRLGDITVSTDNGELLRLGSGTAFAPPYKMGGDIPEGYGGTRDPEAGIVTAMGYFSIDDKANAINQFTGQLRALNLDGLAPTMKTHTRVRLRELYPELQGISVGDDLGYTLGMDYKRGRLMITKRDYEPVDPKAWKVVNGQLQNIEHGTWADFSNTKDFRNLSFTLSYLFRRDRSAWASFHSWYPEEYLFDRDQLYSFEGNALWRHGNDTGSYLNFYGKQHPFMIDFNLALQDAKGHIEFSLEHFYMKLRGIQERGAGKLKGYSDIVFSHAWIKNSWQSSGMMQVMPKKKNLDKEEGLVVEKEAALWKFYGFENIVGKTDNPVEFEILDPANALLPGKPNPGIQRVPMDAMRKRFVDDFVTLRLIFDGSKVTQNMILDYLVWYYTPQLISTQR